MLPDHWYYFLADISHDQLSIELTIVGCISDQVERTLIAILVDVAK